MTREELFQKAKENRKQEKVKEAERKQSYGNYVDREFAQYCGLTANKDFVARILGNPLSAREVPSDMKEVLVSTIRYVENVKVADDIRPNAPRKTFKCYWQPKNEDVRDWIMWRIHQTIMEHTWDSSKRERVYSHKNGPLSFLFNEVAYNGRPDNKYETGWYPGTHIVMNVIDRQDMEWHKNEKKTKLLSKKISTFTNDKGETVVYYDTGVPRTLYNAVWDNIVEYYGDFQNYDVVLRKLENDPWYVAFHSTGEAIKIQDEAKKFIVQGPLTSEELSWERYDLDSIFPVTSYLKIFNRIGGYIKIMDSLLGTKFHDELQEKAEEDKKKFAELNKDKPKEFSSGFTAPAEQVSSPSPSLDAPSDIPTRPASEEPALSRESIPERPVRVESSMIDWDKLVSGEFNGKKYLGVPKMTAENKAMVVGIDPNGQFKYVSEWKGTKVQLYEYKPNKFLSPGEFLYDPLSGDKF